MIYIGVDPGSRTGAFALIGWGKKPLVFPWDNDDFKRKMCVVADVAEQESAVAVVEKVCAMPKQGVSSTWNFAENFGYIQGVLHACNIPFQLVPPRVWKGEFSLNSDKGKSIEVCNRLFPDVCLKRTVKSKKDDSNLAEALLMAEYGRRKL